MPLVSIIMPLYNKDTYIKKTIECLLEQSFDDYELIIVDDGSTDNSGKIALEYERYPQITVIQVENGGVSSARNIGLNRASGEWIWFVDADDQPDRNWLQNASIYMMNSSVDIIIGDFICHGSDGSESRVSINENGIISEKRLAESIIAEQRNTGYFGYLWNKLIKKSFIEKKSVGFQIGLTLAEDLKFMTELYRGNPQCCILHENSMVYYVDTINSSKEKEIDYYEQLVVWWDLFDFIEDAGVQEAYTKKKQIVSGYVACFFFYEYEKKRNISNSIQWIDEHTKYFDYLDSRLLNGLYGKIIKLVKKKRYGLLRRYLQFRIILRSVYRRIKQ